MRVKTVNLTFLLNNLLAVINTTNNETTHYIFSILSVRVKHFPLHYEVPLC